MTPRALPALLLVNGRATRVNAEQVTRIETADVFLAKTRPSDGRAVCEICIRAQEAVAPMTTRVYFGDGADLLVLGMLDAVADALTHGADLTHHLLLEALRQVISIADACVRDDVTASHNRPAVRHRLVRGPALTDEEATNVEVE